MIASINTEIYRWLDLAADLFCIVGITVLCLLAVKLCRINFPLRKKKKGPLQ